MKFLHISDLHIGKVVNGFSMLKEQKFALEQVVSVAKKEKVDGVIIAGDIYDRSIPTAEAVSLLDEFLTQLIAIEKEVYLISGNHDSPERISFVQNILEKKGLHIAGIITKDVKKVVKEDKYGKVNIYLLPFATPKAMKYVLEKETLEVNYNSYMEEFVKQMDINKEERNILVTHHFVVGNGEAPTLSDSETISLVGGTEAIDGSIWKDFDYVALGHIHRPQKVGRETIRYAGSLVKYSFSEVNHEKSMTIVELEEKGQVLLKEIPFVPLHDMRILRGKLSDFIQKEVIEAEDKEDYVQVILTDREELFEPMEQLRAIYPNIMELTIEKNIKTEEILKFSSIQTTKQTTKQLFEQFYKTVMEQELEEEQIKVIEEVIEQIKGE